MQVTCILHILADVGCINWYTSYTCRSLVKLCSHIFRILKDSGHNPKQSVEEEGRLVKARRWIEIGIPHQSVARVNSFSWSHICDSPECTMNGKLRFAAW